MEFERRRHNHAHMNIAPPVDVVFLVLLFFMLTSHFIQEPAIKIIFTQSKTSKFTTDPESELSIHKMG